MGAPAVVSGIQGSNYCGVDDSCENIRRTVLEFLRRHVRHGVKL